jgi:hypothetical protein
MDNLPIKEIAIGVVGAVLGAVVVSAGALGWRFATESRKAAKAAREAERTQWRSGDTQKRSNLTLQYLFAVMSYFLVANLFWLIPDVLEASSAAVRGAVSPSDQWMHLFWMSATISRFVSLIFFFLGLGRILRYASLTRP